MTLLNQVAGVSVIEVRTKEELETISGLIIPGRHSINLRFNAEYPIQWPPQRRQEGCFPMREDRQGDVVDHSIIPWP
jgi:hypothetical protein